MVCSELIFELPLPVKCRMKVTAQVLRRTLLTRSALPAECPALAMPNLEYGCSYGKTAEKFINTNSTLYATQKPIWILVKICDPDKLLNKTISEKYKMVEVLGPSIYQENFPPEIDVYRIPHNRMKQLVTSVMQILPEIQVQSKNKLELSSANLSKQS